MELQFNMQPMRNISSIEKGDRLFYELGYKLDPMNPMYGNNWILSGKFKEIDNVMEYIKEDKLLSDIEYLEHHNFMILK